MLVRVERVGPPLGETDIRTAEIQLATQFPDPYREFLLSFNGGRPIPSTMRMTGSEWSGGVQITLFCGIGVAPEHDLIALTEEIRRCEVPDDAVAIALYVDDPIVLRCESAEDRGIFLWPRSWEAHEVEEYAYGLVPLKKSFEDVLNDLCYFPSELPWRQLIDNSDVEGLRRWLEEGGDPDAMDRRSGDHPVEYAAHRGELEIIELLRARGAKRRNAYLYALQARQFPVVKNFLRQGVSRDDVETAAIHLQQRPADDPELVALLRKAGANL